MRDRRIHRTATPQQLRADPRDAWTATFLGLGTVWQPSDGGVPPADGRDISTPWGPVNLGVPSGDTSSEHDLCLLIRPGAVRPGGATGTPATVTDVRLAGDRTLVTFDVPGAPALTGYAPAGLTVGQRCSIALDARVWPPSGPIPRRSVALPDTVPHVESPGTPRGAGDSDLCEAPEMSVM